MNNAIRLGGSLTFFSRFKKHGQYMQYNVNQISAKHTSFFWIFLFIVLFLQLLIFLCLSCTAVALPLQDVADKDSQKPQQEEERHQSKGNIVWVAGVPITLAI